MGRKVDKKIWLCVVLGVIGLYLLCMVGGLSLSRGDSMVLLCAFLFSGHILMVDHFFAKNGRRTAELYPVLCHSTAVHHLHLLFESPTVADLQAAALPILYAGILSSGVGYTLQIVAQKGLNPTIASLTMSLESVFSALAGWVLFGSGAVSSGAIRLRADVCRHRFGPAARQPVPPQKSGRCRAGQPP